METRAAILTGPLLLSLLLWLMTGSPAWTALIGLFLAQGWVLDVLFYPRVIRWQPPWLTAVLGLAEFVIVYVLAHACRLDLANVDAIWFYWVSWTLAVSTRIVALPLVRLTWLEDGGEFRAIRWAAPPDRERPEATATTTVEPELTGAEFSSLPLAAPTAPERL
jgi:hypothetical protein